MFAQHCGSVVSEVGTATLDHFPLYNIPGLGSSAGDGDGVQTVKVERFHIVGVVGADISNSPGKYLDYKFQ